jgi:phosphoribosylanthranilate isomerase
MMKFCGLTRPDDALAAAAAGATYGGVILAPGGPRTVDPAAVPGIFGDSGLRRVGVFVNETPERVAEAIAVAGLSGVQLHGEESPEAVAAIRAALGPETGVEVWKGIRPRSGEEFAAEAARYAGVVDGILVDGWSAKGRGGTGTSFPWQEVAARRSEFPAGLRLIVAGGLNPANVGEAIALFDPDVVDVASGAELSPGVKDPQKIRDFADAVSGARLPVEGDSHDGAPVRI